MIYLDNNATTAIAPEVRAAIEPFLSKFYGNPSASYSFGQHARRALARAREQAADALGANSENEIVFTSGGTEGTNWVFQRLSQMRPYRKRIVTTAVEHEVVWQNCDFLRREGYEIVVLAVDSAGMLDLDALVDYLNAETALVCVMAANNETGVIFPFEKIAEIVKERSDALVHIDGAQAVGKIPLDLKQTKIDFFAISGHKFHAPKGIGALYIRENVNLPALLLGGGQESKRRAGTENVAFAAGLGAALELSKNLNFTRAIRSLRDVLENEILKNIPNTRINGAKDFRLPNTTNISFAGIEGESIAAHLDAHGICVSTGSACNSETHAASSVLAAMNIAYREAMGAIRFSLSRYTTAEQIKQVLEILPPIIKNLRATSPLAYAAQTEVAE
jgi:cysteine desulfurase